MLVESSIIAPHGGHLVDRRTPDENRKELVREALGLPRVHLDARTLSDLQMIASGVFSPLEGFMLREDYESVVEDMRLSSGLAWSMPVTLSVEEDNARSLSEGSLVALVNGSGEPVATMFLRERYPYDKEREAREVYRTTDREHPGVDYLYRQGDVLLGGEIDLLQPLDRGPFPPLLLRAARAQEAPLREGLEEGCGLPD
jgi:sulfate adenylyltransferase